MKKERMKNLVKKMRYDITFSYITIMFSFLLLLCFTRRRRKKKKKNLKKKSQQRLNDFLLQFVVIITLQDSVVTASAPEERSPIVATEVTAEVTTPKVTIQQQEHDKESSSEKNKETHLEGTHTETQEVVPSESPAVEQVYNIVLKFILLSLSIKWFLRTITITFSRHDCLGVVTKS